jgi:hypothetical protein
MLVTESHGNAQAGMIVVPHRLLWLTAKRLEAIAKHRMRTMHCVAGTTGGLPVLLLLDFTTYRLAETAG